MATKKTASRDEADPAAVASPSLLQYEAALERFHAAIEQLHSGDAAGAREQFAEVARACPDESLLVERARTYERVCERKVAPAPADPQSSDDLYHRAVMRSNAGRTDEAIQLLDRALQSEPTSARLLYARASAWALKGNAEAAVGDLRQAIASEPQVRFQAVNDPDFEAIREEPAFIDVIEPTPSGS